MVPDGKKVILEMSRTGRLDEFEGLDCFRDLGIELLGNLDGGM